MWLLPVLSRVSSAAARIFYRLTVAGGSVPATGPVLLVANHPNSLVDPALVVAVARRPVRFLAAAPIFDDPKVGWLIRAAGSIPVYRRHETPEDMAKNRQMFEAVFEELGRGAAVGIFPEGISHSEPSLVDLKTGAARIALGTREYCDIDPVIVPVGMVPAEKGRYRSKMLVVIGDAIEWSDLTVRGAEDRDAVRELTDRIAKGLRRVTLNVEQWEDRSLVEAAEAIWAEREGAVKDPAERVVRLGITAKILADIREHPEPGDRELRRALRRHVRRLAVLRMLPSDLRADVGFAASGRWAMRRAVVLPSVVVALTGYVLFRAPNVATALATNAMAPAEDRLSTYKVMVGFIMHAIWTILLAVIAGFALNPIVGLAALAGIPLFGVAGLRLRESWSGAGRDVRRFYTLKARRVLMDELREEQSRLAECLEAIRLRWSARSTQ
ncbi:MAG: 1-acyl-sn-glycerol-3-phosphate acyltransferase [Longimicrobiales bacterium]